MIQTNYETSRIFKDSSKLTESPEIIWGKNENVRRITKRNPKMSQNNSKEFLRNQKNPWKP